MHDFFVFGCHRAGIYDGNDVFQSIKDNVRVLAYKFEVGSVHCVYVFASLSSVEVCTSSIE